MNRFTILILLFWVVYSFSIDAYSQETRMYELKVTSKISPEEYRRLIDSDERALADQYLYGDGKPQAQVRITREFLAEKKISGENVTFSGLTNRDGKVFFRLTSGSPFQVVVESLDGSTKVSFNFKPKAFPGRYKVYRYQGYNWEFMDGGWYDSAFVSITTMQERVRNEDGSFSTRVFNKKSYDLRFHPLDSD
jgi:hypothetical protein